MIYTISTVQFSLIHRKSAPIPNPLSTPGGAKMPIPKPKAALVVEGIHLFSPK
jgi:hypothetical protein